MSSAESTLVTNCQRYIPKITQQFQVIYSSCSAPPRVTEIGTP